MRRIVSYVVPKAGAALDPPRLRERLAHALPEYMVPALVMPLEAVPLTPNKKVDAPDSLRREELERTRAVARDISPTAPTGDGADGQKPLPISATLLGPPARAEDNFFDLGGDSIVALKAASRARSAGFDLEVGDILEASTFGKLLTVAQGRPSAEAAAPAASAPATAASTADASSAPLLPAQAWFFRSDFGDLAGMRIRLELRRKSVDPVQLEAAATELVRRHEALRTVFTGDEPRPEIRETLERPVGWVPMREGIARACSRSSARPRRPTGRSWPSEPEATRATPR